MRSITSWNLNDLSGCKPIIILLQSFLELIVFKQLIIHQHLVKETSHSLNICLIWEAILESLSFDCSLHCNLLRISFCLIIWCILPKQLSLLPEKLRLLILLRHNDYLPLSVNILLGLTDSHTYNLLI